MANIVAKITNEVVGGDKVQLLTLSYGELGKAVKAAQGLSKNWKKSLQNNLSIMSSFTVTVSGISEALQSLTQGYNDFDKAMRAANTMAGKDEAGFRSLKDQVNDLAKSIPLAREALADGLYQVISNGVPEDNWISYLEASARASVGGIADLGKTVTVTSTIIKNYGMEWEAAIEVQNKIQTTAKKGVTSFEHLAQALPRVTGNAATLGVSIDELLGAFATLTGVSGNTAEVSTQLAAIFTALIKPSSEATKMAAAMGIEFDAAAIKAAGGMQAFLQQLDTAVKRYAATTGTLEQEVYGRLFGSAEALRALVPLQGELAESFATNVAAMASSAGTIGQDFDNMASTGEAAGQRLINSMASITDALGAIAAEYAPVVSYTAQLGQSIVGVIAIGQAFVKLGLTLKSVALGMVAAAARIGIISKAMVALRAAIVATTAAVRGCSAAIKGLLVATGVGAVLAALSIAVEHFSSTSKEATVQTERLTEAQQRAKVAAEARAAAERAEMDTVETARATMAQHIAQLASFNGTKEQEVKLVDRLNNAYGDTMGYFSSAAEWYKALKTNSEKYCEQLILEARTRILANDIARNEQRRHDLLFDSKGKPITFPDANNTPTGPYPNVPASPFAGAAAEMRDNAVAQLDEVLKAQREELVQLQQQMAGILYEIHGAAVRPNLDADNPDKKQSQLIENARTLREYEHNIAVLRESLLDTYDIDKAAEINAEIKRYEGLAEALRNAGVEAAAAVPAFHENATTIKELNDNLANIDDQRQTATGEELERLNRQREQIQKQLRELESAGTAATAAKPAATVNPMASTLAEIESNISALRDSLQNASLDDAAGINREIALWQQKADAIRSAGIAAEDMSGSMQRSWGNVKSVQNGIEGITSALDGSRGAWSTVTGVVDGFIQTYQGVSSVLKILQPLLGLNQALAATEQTKAAAAVVSTAAQTVGGATAEAAAAAEVPLIAANQAAAASYMQLAAAAYYAAHAYIPFWGFYIASGYVAAAKTIVSSIGAIPFADGGIISGPTLGLIGEYAGASHNPEVVAPLSELSKLLRPAAPAAAGEITLRIKGRDLVGVYNMQNNYTSRI